MNLNSTSDKSYLLGCTLPLILALVIWPLIVVPYLRMRMPGVQIEPSFFYNTMIGAMIGAVVGVIGVAAILVGVVYVAGSVGSKVANQPSQAAVGIVAMIIIVTVLLACIVLLDRYAFHQRQWHDLVARQRTSGTICIGAGCPAGTDPIEGGDSVTGLVTIVTVQLACCLAILALPLMHFRDVRNRRLKTEVESRN